MEFCNRLWLLYIYIYMSLLFASDILLIICYIDELIYNCNKSIGFFLTNITFAFPWFVPITKSFLSVKMYYIYKYSHRENTKRSPFNSVQNCPKIVKTSITLHYTIARAIFVSKRRQNVAPARVIVKACTGFSSMRSFCRVKPSIDSSKSPRYVRSFKTGR